MSEILIDENGVPYIEIPWCLKRYGKRNRLITSERSFEEVSNEPLARAIIDGFKYAEMLENGKFDTVLELAKHLNRDRSPVARMLSLVNLAPDIIKAVFDGTAPSSLTLNKAIYGFPDDWEEQKKFFGMK